jgi:hypothetical protein
MKVLTLKCKAFPGCLRALSKHVLHPPRSNLERKSFLLPLDHLASTPHDRSCFLLPRKTGTQNNSAGLSLHGDSQNRVCCLVGGWRFETMQRSRDRRDVRGELWSIRCSITARIGATPVPGPTQIIGTTGSCGSVSKPLLSPICSESPVPRQYL